MTPVEAVARALAGSEADRIGPFFCDDGRKVPPRKIGWTVFVEDAKAAILALSDTVTENMVNVFRDAYEREADECNGICAAILAALEDEA